MRLVSLQKGLGSEQIEACKEQVPLSQWCDPADLTADALLDTAAAMKNLDLVISVDTAVAHLAGALAIPVWVAIGSSEDQGVGGVEVEGEMGGSRVLAQDSAAGGELGGFEAGGIGNGY